MPAKTNEERREKFEKYNPYAAKLTELDGDDRQLAQLAVAYELAQIRAQLRFSNGNGGSK
jgi:hypothetical protein